MTNEHFEDALSQTREAGNNQGTVGRLDFDQPTSTRDYPVDERVVALDDSDPSPATSDQVDPTTALAEDADAE